MFRSIRHKITFSFFVLCVGPLALSMYWFYSQSVKSLKERTYDHLRTVRETKRKEVESYFDQVRRRVIYFADANITVNGFRDFNKAFSELRSVSVPSRYPEQLRDYYAGQFVQSLHPIHPDTFSVDKLFPNDARSVILQMQYLVDPIAAAPPNPYRTVHDKYHNTFATFAQLNDFYDVLMIEDETGFIIYSANKEVDFGTSLLSDAHANSNLGRLFRKVRHAEEKKAVMIDFESYLPSFMAPVAFIAAPIYDEKKRVGTFVFQIPIEKINQLTTSDEEWSEVGLGATGESYIVGSDCKMRTDSRFILESPEKFLSETKDMPISPRELDLISFYRRTALLLSVCNETLVQTTGQDSGTLPSIDYRGKDVLTSFTTLNVPDVSWSLRAEIDLDEALEPIRTFALNFFVIVGVVIGLVILVSFLIAVTLTRPIRKLAKATIELGKGNLNIQVEERSRDELGMLERSFNKSAEALRIQHLNLLEKQEEITLQAEQLMLINGELSHKNQELDQQKEEITAQADNLRHLNEEITAMNANLEVLVQERTHQLEDQNKVLADYAFNNAHKLRGPLTRILGLINIIQSADSLDDKMQYIELLREAGRQLDKAVHNIQQLIAENENQQV